MIRVGESDSAFETISKLLYVKVVSENLRGRHFGSIATRNRVSTSKRRSQAIILVSRKKFYCTFSVAKRKLIHSLTYSVFYKDVDECLEQPRPCAVNAKCSNVLGSFSCLCPIGYSGDGYLCEGLLGLQMFL